MDVQYGDTNVDTYMYDPMTSHLARRENIKKYKHSKHYHDKQKFFSPFVLSVDGIIVREALVVLSHLSLVMVEKREESLLQVQG